MCLLTLSRNSHSTQQWHVFHPIPMWIFLVALSKGLKSYPNMCSTICSTIFNIYCHSHLFLGSTVFLFSLCPTVFPLCSTALLLEISIHSFLSKCTKCKHPCVLLFYSVYLFIFWLLCVHYLSICCVLIIVVDRGKVTTKTVIMDAILMGKGF